MREFAYYKAICFLFSFLRARRIDDAIPNVDKVVGNAFQPRNDGGKIRAMLNFASAVSKPCIVICAKRALQFVHLIFQIRQFLQVEKIFTLESFRCDFKHTKYPFRHFTKFVNRRLREYKIFLLHFKPNLMEVFRMVADSFHVV